MAITRLKYLYTKYLDNSCTEAERDEFLNMVNIGSHEPELQQLLDNYWDEHAVTAELTNDKANEIFTAIVGNDNERVEDKKRVVNFNVYKWAVAAALLVFAGIAYYLYKPAILKNEIAFAQAKTTAEHKQIRLPDGSTVVLNNNSSLKYPVAFAGNTREVTLQGEGYFDIKHDAGHPFIVHTGKIVTTVLGTAFNINAYSNQKLITVTVTRGKVSVSDDKKVLAVITPDEQVVFNKDQERSVQAVVNSTQTVQWQSNDLYFDDMNMGQAALMLTQKFKVKISFANDAVKKCRFTGTFLHGEKLKDILDVICQFNNATYKFSGNGEVVIDGAGC